MVKLPKILLAMCAAVSLHMLHAAPAGAQSNGGSILNNYEGADIRDFIRTVSVLTGYKFVIDPRLANNKVTIIAPPEATLSSDEIWELFLATMQVNNYAVLPISDGEYKIVPNDTATRQANVGAASAAGGEYVTRIVRLNLVDARTAATNLRGLIGERGIVTPVLESNSIIIVDTASNVSRLLGVIDSIDQDTSVVRTIQLQNAIAGEVAAVLRDLGARSAGESAVGSSGISVVAVDASNTIILRGNPREIGKLLPVIQDLDLAGTSKVDLSVIRLSHADGEEIVPLLTEMIEKSYGEDSANRKPSIVFHAQTNSLVVNADTDTQRIIASVVRQLDIRRPQVLIEAIVVNISDNVARDLGLQYVIAGEKIPFTSQNFSNTQPNVLAGVGAAFFADERIGDEEVTVIDPSGTRTTTTNEGQLIPGTERLLEAAIGSFLGLDGFSIGTGGKSADGTIFGAILTAIEADTDSNILSTPFTVTLDNQPARLQVGQEIPITTGEQTGTDFSNTFRTVERQEVGIILEVTPQISDGDTIRLEITQEVSSINGALTSVNQEFVTNKASVSTTANADNGSILVLGGLIDDNRQITENKVPFLGDIPIAGNLFKSSARSTTKSTLMIFIKPTILRDEATARRVTARKYDYVREQQLLKSRNEKPSIDRLVEEYLSVDPDILPAPVYEEQY
ncbi:secretin N-terminal domain-containing protein [Parvularcula sp. IMCC14364]|uniref:secretin N-terminal domain-containing protein n=1 Tax=Parvularcula sp. IMCC14364 TaxID=3067902 RepID=UPI00274083AC|nr:secretin N-terminal domain-containing protein [Parvularcula sp. IMCC14364]